MIRFGLPLTLALSLGTLATAAPSKDPQVEAQLHALFDKWDLDHDGFLDKEELAKHFRGPKAKPPEGDMYDDKGNLTPLYYQARTKYPDLVFLWSLDTDTDGQISWPEFEKYGQQYATALKQRQQTQQRMLQSIYGRAYRNVRTAQHRNTNYNRHAPSNRGRQQRHTTYHYTRNVSNYQRQAANYQREVARTQAQAMRQYRSAVQRQQNFYRMAVEQRRRWLQQYQSYVRQRTAFVHRMAMRHFASVYRRR